MVPEPVLLMVRGYLISVKVAVTDLAAFIVTTQVPVPEHPSPLHPVKVDPVDAVALNVTVELSEKEAEHVNPQFIPMGELTTEPLPIPLILIFNNG
jgi:hypothetical protein